MTPTPNPLAGALPVSSTSPISTPAAAPPHPEASGPALGARLAQALREGLPAGFPAGLTPAELLPLVEAALTPAQRLATHQALWAAWATADEPARAAARLWLDGRYAAWCEWMSLPWDAPLTLQRLAQAHLGAADLRSETVPELRLPQDPAYVKHLLRHAGVDVLAPRWLCAWAAACVHDLADPLTATAAADLATALQAAMAQASVPWGDGLARLFDLAVHQGDGPAALRCLVRGLNDGRPVPWSAVSWRRWLEGGEGEAADALVLQLAAPMQAAWLTPARLGDARWRADLAQALRRPGPRARLQALESNLLPHRRHLSDPDTAGSGPMLRRAWSHLRALEAAYAMAPQGRLALPDALALLSSTTLARPAAAALARSLALHHLDQGRLQVAMAALAWARHAGCARAAAWQADVLAMLAPQSSTAQRVCLALRAGDDGRPGSAEQRAWRALHEDATAPAAVRTIAAAMQARLATWGALAPCAEGRCQDAPRAVALWQALVDDPELAPEAAHHLHQGPLAAVAPWWVAEGEPTPDGPAARDHLWIPPRIADDSAPPRLWIVLSCAELRHSYPQVASLERDFPADHLLFVRNPEFNWYGDAVFDSLCALVAQRVLPRFRPDQVVCYFGSMGGHGALKLALHHGFRAITFNPQVDLDLWSLFRAADRPRLQAVQRHRSPAEAPPSAWAGTSVYLAVGSGTADRLACAELLRALRAAGEGRLILEKFADPHHPALIKRIASGSVSGLLGQVDARLAALGGDEPPPRSREVLPHQLEAFWQTLDDAAVLKLEVWLRGGRVWAAPSAATGSRGLPSAIRL